LSATQLPGAASKARGRFISTSKGADYYKPLKTRFQRGEFNYKQIAREKDVAKSREADFSRKNGPDTCKNFGH
jgi:hypothetical protein